MKIKLALSLLILGGCVQARDPQLVAMKQAGDSSLTCEQIAVEYKANTEVAQSKIAKNRANDNGNCFSEFSFGRGCSILRMPMATKLTLCLIAIFSSVGSPRENLALP